jgi:hypothetical protein
MDPEEGLFLQKLFIFLPGLLLLFGCGGVPIRGNELLPSPTPVQLSLVQSASLPKESDHDSLAQIMPPGHPIQEPETLSKDLSQEISCADLSYLLDNPTPFDFAQMDWPLRDHNQPLQPLSEAILKEKTSLENPPSPLGENAPSGIGKAAKTVNLSPSGLQRDHFPEQVGEFSAEIKDRLYGLFDPLVDELPLQSFSPEKVRLHELFDSLVDEPSFLSFSPEDVEPSFPGNKTPPSINTTFPSLLNEKVEEFIKFFQEKADTFFLRSLARSQAYEAMMKNIFREKNLPEELFYLALIESGYNPNALSRAKAGGIWQFIAKTARRFGLKVNKWVDERRDPEKSTYAAAAYLKSLYEIFNCWDLATASYNAGEGKVLRAMKKANSQDFWEISRHRYLRQETKKYVPKFLAAVLIAKEPQKYGFSNIEFQPPLVYEKVLVPPSTNLERIARAAETGLSEIRALNPALKRGKTPPDVSLFEINIPPGKKEVFERNFKILSQSNATKNNKHLVRSGETLARIAKKYRLTTKELCDINNLSSRTRIKPGITLLLPP